MQDINIQKVVEVIDTSTIHLNEGEVANFLTSENGALVQMAIDQNGNVLSVGNPAINYTINGIQADDNGNFSVTYSDIQAASDSHTHVISDITGLQDSLDGKAIANHTHQLVSGFSINGESQPAITDIAILNGSDHIRLTTVGNTINFEAVPFETSMTPTVLNATNNTDEIKFFVGSNSDWTNFSKESGSNYIVFLFD